MFMSVPERRTLFLALNASMLNDPYLGKGVTEISGRLENQEHVPHFAHVMADAWISLQCNVSQGQQNRSGCKMCLGEWVCNRFPEPPFSPMSYRRKCKFSMGPNGLQLDKKQSGEFLS